MKIEIKGLKKSFEKDEVFKDLSMEIVSGEILGVAGRNGSGKTTLMQNIVSILKPDEGVIEADGKNLRENPELLQDIIYIPDKFDYFKNYKISKTMEFYSDIYKKFDKEKCGALLEEMGYDIKKEIGSLSKGQLTVVGTIIGLSCNSDILLIDEPYDGVDVINEKKMDRLMIEAREEGKGIMISSHELDKLEGICDRIYIFGDMNLKEFSLENKNEIKKYQIVLEENTDEEKLSGDIIIVNRLGRVYQVLYKGSEEEFRNLMKENGIVQYDVLNTKIEDIMLWNDRKGH